MSDDTQARLAAIERRCREARLPWVEASGDDESCSAICGVVSEQDLNEAKARHDGRGDFPEDMPWVAVDPGCSPVRVRDCFALIANAPADLLWLLERVRALEAELKKSEAAGDADACRE